ncbi:MAG: flavodoxin-dependent (E)-4-hydroxy-3-methylbut-2-enyl-diphosphate synthase [Candidatus Aureabacteria bacterium]|nr:flavodoxin-dependent (E)-4-hydroxy-3-methylbut-2-enyl-diphosphate synthase [Candidatus Auribacterota bacterium]
MKRKKTKKIFLRNVPIGGDAPVSVQSMTKVPTHDTASVVREIKKLEKEGCDIIRVSVLNRSDAETLKKIVSLSPIPVVADIHFSRELALLAIRQGVDGIRINPGNITRKEDWKIIAEEIQKHGTVLRIGANSGSLPQDRSGKNLSPAERLVASAMEAVDFFEKEGVEKIKISLKSSSVRETIEAYEKISLQTFWPLHVGVTATGTSDAGIIKSSLGIGSLLLKGIGDTIRVSLNDTSLREVRTARLILRSLGLRPFGIEIIACPGCGRSQINILKMAKSVEQNVKGLKKDLKVAVMGCIVNGPGEAEEADIGIAGGKGEAILFKKGKVIKRVKEKDIVKVLISEIKKIQ